MTAAPADQTDQPPHLVFTDLETTGFEPADGHFAVSAAWWDLDTGARGSFFTRHTWRDVAVVAEPGALRVNRYLDVIHGQAQDDSEHTAAAAMWDALHGAVMAGSKPSFDWSHMPSVFRAAERDERVDGLPELASHRLVDLANYTAGRLGLDPVALPGQSDVCRMLGVEPGDHTAVGDVTAGGSCLLLLRDDAWVAAYLEWLADRDPLADLDGHPGVTNGARAAELAGYAVTPQRYILGHGDRAAAVSIGGAS